MKGITFDYNYLYSEYADDTTFFFKDNISTKHMVDTCFFSYFSRLKPSSIKSEIEGIGVLKKVQVTVSGMRRIDLNNDSLKMLGTQFSKLKDEENLYKIETDIQLVLKYGK